jgi:hypothetical protein
VTARHTDPGRCGHTGWTRELNGVPAQLGGPCNCCLGQYATANGIWLSRGFGAQAEADLELGI